MTKNFVIKTNRRISGEVALKRAKNFLKITPTFKDGYLMIDGPTICDLFIVEDGSLRPCNGSEWVHYFRTYLYPYSSTEPVKPVVKRDRYIIK